MQLHWLYEFIKIQEIKYWDDQEFYKLIVPDMLSKAGISRIIILDTEVLVLGNLERLWSLFEQFSSEQLVGLVDDHLARFSSKPDKV